MPTSRAFTEQDVGDFFDQTPRNYLSFWDDDGVLHTGYFSGAGDTDYLGAAARTCEVLAADAGIEDSSYVLDVGSGCGNFLIEQEVSQRARTHVYDRVRWNGGYSFTGYQAALEETGFEIILARNLESHIQQTYRVLGTTAREGAAVTQDEAGRNWTLAFAESCDQIEIAIDDGEFGWGMFTARKRRRARP